MAVEARVKSVVRVRDPNVFTVTVELSSEGGDAFDVPFTLAAASAVEAISVVRQRLARFAQDLATAANDPSFLQ